MSGNRPCKQACKKNPKPSPAPVALTDADIDRLAKAITKAILDAEQQKAQAADSGRGEAAASRKSIKDVLRVFFWPLKKLKTENSALSLVKLTTSSACWAISMLGYIAAVVLLLSGIPELVTNFSMASVFVAVLRLLFAVAIYLLSRLIKATGLEIERTNNEGLIFGISSFILALIAIIVSMSRGG